MEQEPQPKRILYDSPTDSSFLLVPCSNGCGTLVDLMNTTDHFEMCSCLQTRNQSPDRAPPHAIPAERMFRIHFGLEYQKKQFQLRKCRGGGGTRGKSKKITNSTTVKETTISSKNHTYASSMTSTDVFVKPSIVTRRPTAIAPIATIPKSIIRRKSLNDKTTLTIEQCEIREPVLLHLRQEMCMRAMRALGQSPPPRSHGLSIRLKKDSFSSFITIPNDSSIAADVNNVKDHALSATVPRQSSTVQTTAFEFASSLIRNSGNPVRTASYEIVSSTVSKESPNSQNSVIGRPSILLKRKDIQLNSPYFVSCNGGTSAPIDSPSVTIALNNNDEEISPTSKKTRLTEMDKSATTRESLSNYAHVCHSTHLTAHSQRRSTTTNQA